MELLIASVVIAATVSFLCSFTEAALLSLTPGQLADIEARRPNIGARVRALKENIKKPIAVILMCNTSAATIGATVAGSQFAVVVGHDWIAVFSIAFTYMMFQFTEILPKTLGVQHNKSVMTCAAIPLSFLARALSPLVAFFHLVNRPFERRRPDKSTSEALDEITALVRAARVDRIIEDQQARIISVSVRLSKLTAAEVMIPVEQITFLSATQSLVDAMVTAHTDPHTRFPIIEGNDRNKVLGYVNFKEIVYRARTNPADPTLRGIIRPIYFVDPTQTCNRVLKAFVDEHVHMALVRAPDTGATLGLITLEDVVEELVGDIEDEFDRLPRMCQSLSGGVWIVGGGLPASELFTRAGFAPEQTTDNVSTWLLKRLGAMPHLGQVIQMGERDVTIRRLRRGKVFEILVTPRGMAPRDFL
jgi:CBS domain containing-hemolysin-like protein